MRRVMGAGPAARALPVLACALGLALGPAAASAVAQGSEILQVAPGGSDPTCVAPCASVQVAVNRAGHDLQSGAASSALIVVAPASFSGNVTIPALSATTPLTIQGAGPSTVLVGTGVGSVVTVPAGSRVAITDLSIEGGKAVNGGGVSNAGNLSLLRDTIALNAAISPGATVAGTGLGGGIFNSGSLILQDSTVSNNQASSGGAGVEIDYGTLNAARDAFVANIVGPDEGAGGGLDVSSSSYCCSVTDSTIASNVVTDGFVQGAGVSEEGTGGLRLYGDTIAGNTAPSGAGGIYVFGGTVDIGGTLFAHNSPRGCAGFFGVITPHGSDLSDDSSCPVELPGVDPKLQPLAKNGGLSRTMAITASSPAYDVNTLCAGTDQRVVSRVQLGATRCDIGAYQVSAPSTFVANQTAGSVTAYATGATGDVAPTLALAGASTGLSSPTGVVVDVTGKVFVANAGNNSITEYAPEVNGNAAPTATIAGSLTQLSHPQDLALDPSGDLFVTNADASVTEYPPDASGNVAPKARIAGASTKLSQPAGVVVDASGALRVSDGNGTVNTYRAGANGNAAPVSRLTISGGAARPFGLNFDPSGNLVVADAAGAQVDTFAASAAGSAPPLSLLSGTPPALASPVGLDLDVFGDIFVANRASNTISEYPPQSHGSASPLAMIAGTSTGLLTPSFLSELPPPPPPRVNVTTARRQSRKRILRGGITLKLRASGTLAFRSRPITLTARARANGHIVAAARTTALRPGHATLVLIPNRRAAHIVHSSHAAAIKVIVTIRGGAGRQTHRLTVRLTR
jgi:hypothetical protein